MICDDLDIQGSTHDKSWKTKELQRSYKTEVILDGESVQMEVDTGSAVTLLRGWGAI